jgi:hypothetical protein
MDPRMRAELERRIDLIEKGGEDRTLPPLPLIDVLAAGAALVLLTVILLWWAL